MSTARRCRAHFRVDYNDWMDSFFPQEDLQRVPPDETRILSLEAEPYPDGDRIRVQIHITPFQVRPYIELTLTDANGDEVATASIVEPMSPRLELTMHLRGATASPFRLEARLFYPDGPQPAPAIKVFEVTATTSEKAQMAGQQHRNWRSAWPPLGSCCSAWLHVPARPHPSRPQRSPSRGHPLVAAATPTRASASSLDEQWLLLSVEENGYAHLFSFDLATSSLTRLTSGRAKRYRPIDRLRRILRGLCVGSRGLLGSLRRWTSGMARHGRSPTPPSMTVRRPGRRTWRGWRTKRSTMVSWTSACFR